MKASKKDLDFYVNLINKITKDDYSYYQESNIYTLYVNKKILGVFKLNEIIAVVKTINILMQLNIITINPKCIWCNVRGSIF